MKWVFITVENLGEFLGYCKLKFASMIHTHTVSHITDFPSIPTKTSQLTNDKEFSIVTLSDDGAGNVSISIEN